MIDLRILSIIVFVLIYVMNSFIMNDNEFRLIKDSVTNILRK